MTDKIKNPKNIDTDILNSFAVNGKWQCHSRFMKWEPYPFTTADNEYAEIQNLNDLLQWIEHH